MAGLQHPLAATRELLSMASSSSGGVSNSPTFAVGPPGCPLLHPFAYGSSSPRLSGISTSGGLLMEYREHPVPKTVYDIVSLPSWQ
jgi:hypothetical protein